MNVNLFANLRIIFFAIIFMSFTNSCVRIENKFIQRRIIAKLPEPNDSEYLYYNLFKIGPDNYKFDFFIYDSNKMDSIKIQCLFLNDANLANFNLENIFSGDSIILISNFPLVRESDELLYKKWKIFWKSS